MGLRPVGRLLPPPVPMLNIGAPTGAVPLGIAKGPPGAGAAPPVNENAGAGVAPPTVLPAGFDPAEKLNAGGGDAAAAPKIPAPAAEEAGAD